MKKARHLYERWGAKRKVRVMENDFPQLLGMAAGERTPANSMSTISSTSIDMTTLKKALLAIAEETIHSRMLEKIISSAIEFAGAQKGCLLLRKEKDFYVEAEFLVDSEKPEILKSLAIDQCRNLSTSVINFVKRTATGIVIDDASKPSDQLPGLDAERYIIDNKVKSVLCIPISTGRSEKSELIGLLYLENNRAASAFTEERIETLEIICLSAAGRLELSLKAATDGLTGLYNHDYFQSMLQQELLQSQRQLRNLSVIMIDIDHFKKFNDKWGHQVGDLVLKKVARSIQATCRESDIVARYGGEEMVVILPETNPQMAVKVAERIRKQIENVPIQFDNQNLNVTASLGVSSLSAEVKDKEILIKKADAALYNSKDRGRNQVTLLS